jgi:hypothetical protein
MTRRREEGEKSEYLCDKVFSAERQGRVVDQDP